MLLTYAHVEKALRKVGLRGFSKRKMQRWAAPVVSVTDGSGQKQNLGIISGGRRKGKGQGRGWDWVLPERDLITVVFVEYALEKMHKRALKGETLGDAALWAWLWGALVPLPVVRYYLLQSVDRFEKEITVRLHRARRYHDDEPHDLIDRLSREIAYDHGVLRKVGVPVEDRQQGVAEVLASLQGLKWSDTKRAYDVNERTVAEPRWGKLKELLIGDASRNVDQFFTPLSPSDIARHRKFFSFKGLRELYRDCSAEWLGWTQARFSTQRRFIDGIADAVRTGKRIPKPIMDQAKDVRALHTMLSHLPPDAVISLHLQGILWARPEANKSEKAEPRPAKRR